MPVCISFSKFVIDDRVFLVFFSFEHARVFLRNDARFLFSLFARAVKLGKRASFVQRETSFDAEQGGDANKKINIWLRNIWPSGLLSILKAHIISSSIRVQPIASTLCHPKHHDYFKLTLNRLMSQKYCKEKLQFGLFFGRTGIFLGFESTFAVTFLFCGLFLCAAPNEIEAATLVDPFWIACLVLFVREATRPGLLFPVLFFCPVFGVEDDLKRRTVHSLKTVLTVDPFQRKNGQVVNNEIRFH